MAGICKGKCETYKTTKRYKQGVVRCSYCEKFIMWEGLWCPCCRCKVSRKTKYKSKPKRIQYHKDMAEKRRRKTFEFCISAWKHEQIRYENRKGNMAYEQIPLIKIFRNCFKPLFNT